MTWWLYLLLMISIPFIFFKLLEKFVVKKRKEKLAKQEIEESKKELEILRKFYKVEFTGEEKSDEEKEKKEISRLVRKYKKKGFVLTKLK